MKRVYLEITNSCNLNCPFCTNNKNNDFLSISEINNYLDQINNALDLDGVKIKNVPTIIYVSDNTITQDNIISREDKKIMDVSDFQKLLDINEINEP